MNKAIVMFLLTVLLALLAILLVIACSALLFGDEYLPSVVGQFISSIQYALNK